MLLRLLDDGVPPSIATLLEAVDLLKSAGAESSVVAEYRALCRARLPIAWVFASEAEKAERSAREEKKPLPNGKADL